MHLQRVLRAAGFAAALVSSAAAMAVPVATVGSVDLLRGSTFLADSGAATEQAFVDSILGAGTYTLTGKFDDLGDIPNSGFEPVVGGAADGFAFDFGAGTCTPGEFAGVCSTNPDFFLIRIGTGGSPDATDTHYLFENLSSTQWAYVLLSQFEGVTNMNIERVSHISVGGGDGSTDVPTPGTVALLGAALAGLAIGARRRKH